MKAQRVIASLFAAALLVTAAEAAAKPRGNEHGADCQICSEGASGLELTVPLWLPFVGLGGEGRDHNGDIQYFTYDPKVQFAFMAQLRLRLGPIGIDFTGNGGGFGTQVLHSEQGDVLGELDLHGYFGKVVLNWHTPPYRLGYGRRATRLALWPYLGVRYAWLKGTGSSSDSDDIVLEGKTTWGEPVFGMKTLLDLRRGWLLGLEGDVGGFNVGTELSVWANARVQYAMTDWWHLWVGWAVYYARLSTDDAHSVELVLQGPGIGIGFSLF